MTSTLYRSFLRVLEKWPTDPTKKGRDLGEYIRVCVAESFSGVEPSDSNKCEQIHGALNRIGSDKYKQLFYVSGSASSTGLSQSECQQIVSNEFLKYLADEDKGKVRVLKEKFSKSKDKDTTDKKGSD